MIDIPTNRALKAIVAKSKKIDKCDLCIFQELGLRCSDFSCSKEYRDDNKDVYFRLVFHEEEKHELL